jgi:hypothetical protein
MNYLPDKRLHQRVIPPNPVILSVAKDPRDAGREWELAGFLAGVRFSKKVGKSEFRSKVKGSFATLRMTGIMKTS